jgi:hypothetical protein
MFVFRKNREWLSTQRLIDEIRTEFRLLASGTGSVIDTLVRAGELETGLADAGSTEADRVACVVDQLASALCGEAALDVSILQSLDQLQVPPFIRCAFPEGFSYYGLSPLDFADLARRMHTKLGPRVAVIGIRSVGSTLGAVVAAALRTCGASAERITVRPEGEPYNRKTSFSEQHLGWIQASLRQQAAFVVVDEGPGFSGSTFLSVANALVERGVPQSKVVLMGSRPLPAHAAARGQAEAWSRFQSCTIDYASHPPAEAGRSLGDGAWREVMYANRSCWPACWAEQERIKHLSVDGKTLFKFEGLGRFGELARQQAQELAHAGLSPRLLGFEQGYAGYEFVSIPGRPLATADLGKSLLSSMAEYCAFRAAHFPAENSDLNMLAAMAGNNLEVEFGGGFRNPFLHIPLERPVYPDCRMQPHEWLMSGDGGALKSDAVGHAEGHQLPGPADIAWDLAGAIVEWGLAPAAAAFFLAEYRRRSGDPAEKRLQPYLLLYSVLRMAQCRMSSVSTAHRREARYLRRQYAWYAKKVSELLRDAGHQPLLSIA